MVTILKITTAVALAGAISALICVSSFSQDFDGSQSPDNGPFPARNTQFLSQDNPDNGGGQFGGQGGGRFGGQGGGGRFGGQGGGRFGGQGGQGGDPEQRRDALMQQLGLSQEQSDALKQIRENAKSQSEGLRQQIQSKRQALMQYMASPNASEEKAKQMSAELSGLQQQMGDLRMKTWFEMRSKLSPDQQQKLQQMRDQMKERRGQMGGGQGGFGGQGSGGRFGNNAGGGRFGGQGGQGGGRFGGRFGGQGGGFNNNAGNGG